MITVDTTSIRIRDFQSFLHFVINIQELQNKMKKMVKSVRKIARVFCSDEEIMCDKFAFVFVCFSCKTKTSSIPMKKYR